MRISALPFLVFVLATPALVAPVFAQGDAATEMARQRFEEGVKLFDKGDYERARAAFLQAWALKKHPAVLLNLAQCELRSGEHVAAARHFAQYLHEYPDTPESQQDVARRGLAEARLETGQLDIAVDMEGAEIFVDGESVGRAPLPGPLDVTPGTHTIEVKLAGTAPVSQQAAVTAGSKNTVNIALAKPDARGPAVGPAQPPRDDEPEEEEPEEDEPETGRKSFLSWASDDPVAWGTLGATGLGLGLGISFAFVTSSRVNEADQVASQISAVAKKDPDLSNYQGLDRRTNPCADPVPITTDTDYRPACAQLQDKLDSRDSARSVMWIGFGVAAVGAVGTGVAYYLRSEPKDSTASNSPPGFTAVTPVWSPEMTGIGMAGTF